MRTKTLTTFIFLLLQVSIFSMPTMNCSLYRNSDYSNSGTIPLYNGYPIKGDLTALSQTGQGIIGRIESLQPVRYGELTPMRTTLYINQLEVTRRDHFVLVLPFSRAYLSTIRFEGHTFRCRVL